jgi:hypothetical protein
MKRYPRVTVLLSKQNNVLYNNLRDNMSRLTVEYLDDETTLVLVLYLPLIEMSFA